MKKTKLFIKKALRRVAFSVSMLTARLQMFLSWLEEQIFPANDWQSSPYRSEASAIDHWLNEIASLRSEIILILNSLLWVFGILALAGFTPSSGLMEIIVSQFSQLSARIWNSALFIFRSQFSPTQASIISLNTIGVAMFLRAVAIAKREGSQGKPDSLVNFGGYIYFFSFIIIFSYSIYAGYQAFSSHLNHPDVANLELWRRIISTIGVVVFVFIAANLLGWVLFFLFYICVVRFGPAKFMIFLASTRPYFFAVCSFLSMPLIFASLAWLQVLFPSALDVVILRVLFGVIIFLAYFNLLCLMILSFGVPRIPLALLLSCIVVAGLDFLLPNQI